MKSLYLQIEFIDTKLLPCFGIKGILDYQNKVFTGEKEQELNNIDLVKLNALIEEFRNVFNSKNFNLHKTQYKINSQKQATCLLKMCLEITSIPYDHSVYDGKKILRLISQNNILDKYINTIKMTEICNSKIESSNEFISNTTKTVYIEKCDKEKLLSNIKKTYKIDIGLNPSRLLDDSDHGTNVKPVKILNIDLKKYFKVKSIKSLKLKFVSKKFNDQDILSSQYIEYITNIFNIMYILEIGGQRVWKDKFVQHGEIIISDLIIPLKSLTYHSVNILLCNIDNIIGLFDNLELIIECTYVDFYAEFENKLEKIALELEIEHCQKYNILRVCNGISVLAFWKYLTKSEYDEYTIKHKSSKNTLTNTNLMPMSPITEIPKLLKENMELKTNLKGSVEKFNGLEGYNITESSGSSEWVYPLVYGYEFSSCTEIVQITNENITYYRVSTNKVSLHKYLIHFNQLNCDSINCLDIVIGNLEKIPDIKSILNIYPLFGFDVLYTQPFKYTVQNNQIKIIINPVSQINLANKLYGFSGIELVFETNLPIENIIFKQIGLIVKKYFWNNPIRDKYLLKNKDLFVLISKDSIIELNKKLELEHAIPSLFTNVKNKNPTIDI